MGEVEKEIAREEKAVEKFFKNKANIWMLVSAVLLVVIVCMLLLNSGISKNAAGQKILDFAKANGVDATLVSVTSKGSFYEVIINIQNQPLPLYVTKDGKYFSPEMVELNPAAAETPAATPKDVPKTDKPKVELYTWGYCPYGVAAQGPLAEVATLLKSNADFEIVPYYDGHGAFETQQNKIQLCIQKNFKSLYWNYAAKFVTDVYPKCSVTQDITCDKDESVKIMNAVGINSATVLKCVESEGAALFEAASAKAQTNSVSGSPTLIVNGVVVNAARNSEAYKTAICNAFNTAPSACSSTLDSTDATASGNCG